MKERKCDVKTVIAESYSLTFKALRLLLGCFFVRCCPLSLLLLFFVSHSSLSLSF